MGEFQIGMKVKPLTGFWKGFEGIIIAIYPNNDYPIEVEFEENETNCYYEEQLEIVA
ncbi:hypothetical protein [Bacillus sp. M6-12]|uniref:hypothetical protein n=1 Tax=Bacillus sp. M6-12 TaxID=2054166 RepID=UPI0015E07374|nr:hypothetical protein [Bacillus sp. M6-12]